MKFLLFALAGLLALAVVGCSLLEGTATITQGEELTGTIINGDTNVDVWKSKASQVEVRKGVEYFIRLTHDNDETVNVWSPDANAFLAEANSEVNAHTAAYRFSETGPQEQFVADSTPMSRQITR
ncbi:MAG TPA: hypothetical protein EYG27_03235 [Dehalococcoidia bacterium]|jgi:hypothetical protein|nr:hypothetical protein [Dehalococcoidia bacterium]HIL30531.1 hypothetical protein [Dehalococcoidia bacterium]